MKPVIVIVLVTIFFAIGVVFWSAKTKPVPRYLKLLDFDGTNSMASFELPRGGEYNLAFGVEGVKNLDEGRLSCQGSLKIINGTNIVYELGFDTNHVSQAFWIERGEAPIGGYMLTLPRQGRVRLSEVLGLGKRYVVEVNFVAAPPNNGSLWLCWRQNGYQSGK